MPEKKQQVPSIGRIVHYKLPGGTNRGHYRPAIIVRVWDEPATPESLVQLQVFTDGQNDGLVGFPNVIWETSVKPGDGFGEYIWPPYVPAVSAPAEAGS